MPSKNGKLQQMQLKTKATTHGLQDGADKEN